MIDSYELATERLKKSLYFIYEYEITTIGDDIIVNGIVSFDDEDSRFNINAINSSSGIYDIIDEIIFRKLDRGAYTYGDKFMDIHEMNDIGAVFMYDQEMIYATLIDWVDRSAISKAAQFELYGNYQLKDVQEVIEYLGVLKKSKSINLNSLLTELANEGTVALNDEEVVIVKDKLREYAIDFETWRRDNNTIIVLPTHEEEEMLFELIGEPEVKEAPSQEPKLVFTDNQSMEMEQDHKENLKVKKDMMGNPLVATNDMLGDTFEFHGKDNTLEVNLKDRGKAIGKDWKEAIMEFNKPSLEFIDVINHLIDHGVIGSDTESDLESVKSTLLLYNIKTIFTTDHSKLYLYSEDLDKLEDLHEILNNKIVITDNSEVNETLLLVLSEIFGIEFTK